jgi:DNA replication protein DnaC
MHGWLEKVQEEDRQRQAEFDALPEAEKKRIRAEEALREEEQKRRADAEEHERRMFEYKRKGITPRYYESTWENWIADTPNMKKAFDLIKKNAWSTNLFLWGNNGTGKTHLAMCLTKDGATYRRLADICREIRRDFDREEVLLDKYGNAKLLVIDEIGRQKESDFEKNTLFEIIDRRWGNMLPTTLITNLKPQEFSDRYDKPIIDRVRPLSIHFDWKSHRQPLSITPEPPKPNKQNNEEDIDF